MKILLAGEFSGFHRALKLGLQEHGHEVILAGSPDGFKNIEIDINLWPSGEYKNKAFHAFLKQFTILKGVKGLPDAEVVQFISPLKFSNSVPFYGKWYNELIYNTLIKKTDKAFLAACGNDPVYCQIGRKSLDYNPLDAEAAVSGKLPVYATDKKALDWNIKLARGIDGVIPSSYEYRKGYETLGNSVNLAPVIPMPVYTSGIRYEENVVRDGKVRILHGITRPAMKGTPIIMEALNRIKEKYPNEVEVITVNRLSYSEYLQEVQRANCLIDQCNSYGYGINALVGLAMGKVVLSGAEPEELAAIGVDSCPVINIKPDSDQIFEAIEKLIIDKKRLPELGEQSRKYVEQVHDAVSVAEQYLRFWENR